MKLNSIHRGGRSLRTLHRSKISKACRTPLDLEEFKPIPDLISVLSFLDSKGNVKEWKPFSSFLIDTVKVKVCVKHQPLSEYAQGNPNVKQDGYRFLVRCPSTGAVAQVVSRENSTVLLLEFSIPKWLTGQNIVGHLDVHAGCLAGIKKALKLLGLIPTREERQVINRGEYTLTRIDVTVHVDCQTSEQAEALMLALRIFLLRHVGDISMIGHETLYIGQHSKRRTFKMYRKGIELQKKGRQIPPHVYGSKFLTRMVTSLVRFELTLRGKELTRIGLSSPIAWNKQVAKKQIDLWLGKLREVEGVVPNLAAIENLSPVMQNKLLLWLGGHVDAFSRGVTRDSYREARKKVEEITGIDIEQRPDVDLQAAAVTTISQLFTQGLGFKTHEKRWPKFLAAVRANPQPAQTVTTSQPQSQTPTP